MDMETVTLSRIVQKLAPELFPFLTRKELSMSIVLREGMDLLEHEDAIEIVQHSIYEHQKQALLH